MSGSGFETKVVAENPKPEKQVVMGHVGFSLDDVEYGRVSPMALQELVFRRTEERNDALAKIDKLEDKLRASEAAGAEMRDALMQVLRDYDHDSEPDFIHKALSSSCGNGVLEEINGWESVGAEISKADPLGHKNRVTWPSALAVAKGVVMANKALREERDQLKAQLDQEKATSRDWAEMMRGTNFRLQGDVSDLHKRISTLNDQLLEASKQAVDVKAELEEMRTAANGRFKTIQELHAKLAEVTRERDGLDQAFIYASTERNELRRKIAEKEKEAGELWRACWDARALIRQAGFGDSKRWPESIDPEKVEQAHNLLSVKVGELQDIGRDYVHKSEVEKAVEREREALIWIARELDWKTCAEEMERAIRARGGK